MNRAFIHGCVVTVNDSFQIWPDGGLLVSGDRILEVGPAAVVRQSARERGVPLTDCRGKVLFPGLINTHVHLFQSLLKGLGTDRVMESWWAHTIGRTACHLDGEHIGAAAQAGMLEAMGSGTTTMLDYMYANPLPGAGDVILDEARKLGMRMQYGRGFNVSNGDLGVPERLLEPLDDVLEDCLRLRQLAGHDGELTRIWLAPAVNWSLTRPEMLRLRDFSRQETMPLTMHLLETPTDREIWTERYGKDLIRDLEEEGLFDGRFLAVHGVLISPEEINRLARKGVGISHNPVSNMYLASGVAPVPEMLETGLTVSLGTDGAASNNTLDMLETMKITALVHKASRRDPTAMTAGAVLKMATIDGARCLGLDGEIGSLEAGKRADIVIYNPQRTLTSAPVHDVVSMLVYSASPEGVEDVIIGGRYRLKDRQPVGLQQQDVISRLNRAAGDLMTKVAHHPDAVGRVCP